MIRLFGKLAVVLAVCEQREQDASAEVQPKLLCISRMRGLGTLQPWAGTRNTMAGLFTRRCLTELLCGPVWREFTTVGAGGDAGEPFE